MKCKATLAYLNSLEATRRSRTGKPSIDAQKIEIDKIATGTKETEAAAEAAAEEEGTEAEAVVPSVTRAIRRRKRSDLD